MSTSPILNTPYDKPDRYWRLDSAFRATDEVKEGRRASGASMTVPQSSNNAVQSSAEDIEPHPRINRIRVEVSKWRDEKYPGVSRETRDLLLHWTDTETFPRPFFCQVEALETLIWLDEAGPRLESAAHAEIIAELRETNDRWNEGIQRWALKMATGTGKTLVMAMIILWKVLNRRDLLDVVVIVPNLTVRSRLRELDPVQGLERYASLLPAGHTMPAGRVRISILNFHKFHRQTEMTVDGPKDEPSSAVKSLLKSSGAKDPENWTEDTDKMIRRVLRRHRGSREILVFNDEAHHCYRPPVSAPRGDKETREFEESAALWFTALRALREQGRCGQVIDLSATPMFLRKPVGCQYELFPWTISDYPLIEAVEAGLTKIPRVPTKDDSSNPDPLYRDIYNHLVKSERKLAASGVPSQVIALLGTMHDDYRNLAAAYESREQPLTPVMVVVANSVSNADALYEHIAGSFDKQAGTWRAGAYEEFSNVRSDCFGPVGHPPTLLVHSRSGDASEEQRSVLMQQEFFSPPGKTPSSAERQQYLRRVFDTISRKGEPGERIRCVISVSMLTEGWDVRTVTHIFGFRAFSSQLLCEQVAGRALRRTSFPPHSKKLQPEYASIFGVPFNFMRGDGPQPPPPPSEEWTVCSLKNRANQRIRFPIIDAYRIEPKSMRCSLDPNLVEPFVVQPADIPTETVISGVIGDESLVQTEISGRRNEVIYRVANRAMQQFLDGRDNAPALRRRALFASMVIAVRDWLKHPKVQCPDDRIPLLAHDRYREEVPLQIASACVENWSEAKIHPVFADERDALRARQLDTSSIEFQTTLKHRYPDKGNTVRSELSAAACHTRVETKVASVLDNHQEIDAWARNYRIGLRVPYLDRRTGHWRFYEPDFIARTRSGRNLVIEYKGIVGEDSDIKSEAVQKWWIPAVNGSDDPCCDGNWDYVFIPSGTNIAALVDNAINS